jgi:hypothetical protein
MRTRVALLRAAAGRIAPESVKDPALTGQETGYPGTMAGLAHRRSRERQNGAGPRPVDDTDHA